MEGTTWGKRHKSQFLTLPPSTGSDDFRLLCDSSSNYIFLTQLPYLTHKHSSLHRLLSVCQILASLCRVKVNPPAQGIIYCKHLNRYELQRICIYWNFWNWLNICFILALCQLPTTLLYGTVVMVILMMLSNILKEDLLLFWRGFASLGFVFIISAQMVRPSADHFHFLFFSPNLKLSDDFKWCYKFAPKYWVMVSQMAISRCCDYDSQLF